jgi:hypothetical protein
MIVYLKSKQKLMTAISYDADKRSVTVTGVAGKNSVVSIYNDSGNLVGKLSVATGTTKELKEIPSETIIVIVKNGKYILADRINARR